MGIWIPFRVDDHPHKTKYKGALIICWVEVGVFSTVPSVKNGTHNGIYHVYWYILAAYPVVLAASAFAR